VLQQFTFSQPLDEYPDGSHCRIDGGIGQAETAKMVVEGFLDLGGELSSARGSNVKESLKV